MRVNVYAEEMTDRVEIITKTIEGQEFTAVRFYLYLPVTVPGRTVTIDGCMGQQEVTEPKEQIRGPFLHHEGDDDSSAVTFWGKGDLRKVLLKAVDLLDKHYAKKPIATGGSK